MRVKSAAINSTFSIVQKLVETVLSFIYRTIFIQILGVTYLGVNGLFTNIFSVLSLMELGVGSSIIFLMYKPLADKDTEQIKTYMKFYSSMYKVIAIVISIVGVILIPFLPYIITTDTEIPDLIPIYLLTLLNTVVSYLFAYKRSILEADQKAYYNSINYSVFSIINTLSRIVILLITKNFLLTLGISVIIVLLSNIEISIRVNKLYPYLKEKNVKKLHKTQKSEIIKRMKAIMMHKVGNIVITSTDNIIISSFISIVVVGIYSNYSMITNIIYTTVSLIFISVTASVGNLKVTESGETSERIYNRMFLLNFFIYFVISITSWTMFNDLIYAWVGDEFLLEPFVVFLIIAQLYVSGMRHTPVTFINSSGLNYNSRFKPIAEAIINLTVSIIGAKLWGISGVILGTIFAYLSCSAWIEPKILYKHWFKKSPVKYYLKYILYMALTVIFAFIIQKLCIYIQLTGWYLVIAKFIISVVLSTLIFIILFFKTEEFKYYVDLVIEFKNKLVYKKYNKKNNSNALVSIIVPCYNGENFIARCLESIYNQTYKNLEIIVVNDGSTDDSEKILLEYKKKFEKANMKFVYVYQKNQGLGSAINTGLKYFTGEYLCWPDIDDFLEPNSIEIRLNYLQKHKSYACVTSNANVYYEDDLTRPVSKIVSNLDLFNPIEYQFRFLIKGRSLFCPGCHMISTKKLLRVNPNREIYPARRGQNWQMLMPIYYSYKRKFLNIPLYNYLIRKDSMSRGDISKEKKVFRCEEHREILLNTISNMVKMSNFNKKRYSNMINKMIDERILDIAVEYGDKELFKNTFENYRKRKNIKLDYYFKRKKLEMNHKIVEKQKCTGCSACYNICPKDAIEMKEDEEGFLYPVINKEKCINCGLCEKICPVLNENKKENKFDIKTIGTYNKNELQRKESSSGGIFTLIAEDVISRGGYVCGAGFNEKFEVVHKIVNKKEELEELKGSKYVQSKLNDTFKKIEKLLKDGKEVLFIGTPCQVAGIYAYLRKEYDNLYTADIVCHGVPSVKLWRKYTDNVSKGRKIIKCNFRNKDISWKDYSLTLNFSDNTSYKRRMVEDNYMRIYLKNIALRYSCYDCKFSKLPRIADISLGDFWGVENKYSEFSDNKGTSLVLINTEKGSTLFESIKDKTYYKENCDLEFAIKNNPCICSSVKMPEKRKNFFVDLDKMKFEKLAKKYVPKQNLYYKVKSKLKLLLKK